MSANLIVILLIHIYVTFAQHKRFYYYNTVGSAYMSGAIITEVTTRSRIECGVMCTNGLGCVSYNYRHEDYQCQMLGRRRQSGILLNNAGYSFTEIEWQCDLGSCYCFSGVNDLQTRSAAAALCSSHGAHLLAIETEQEQQLIQDIFNAVPDYLPSAGTNGAMYAWMDLINDGTWEHSGELATFTKWGNGEPDTAENCCVLKSVHTWGDVSCHRIHAYVCEK